uniref:Tudor domain-containing protein n=1 Tax=Glossina morsitans morsitans TaxID=37546 RepID=A0A1B0GBH6_GLOMM
MNFKHLYEAPDDYIRIPFHAIPVILKEVPDCYMTEEIRNFMYSCLNDINVCLKYKPEDFISDKGYLQHVPLPTSDNIELMVMDNSLTHSALLSCTLKLYALEIRKFNRDLQKYAQNSSTTCYAPRMNELCIAKYSVDGKWYRDCCLQLVDDGHPSIMFIDYGKIVCTGIDDIRPYPLHFLSTCLIVKLEASKYFQKNAIKSLWKNLKSLYPMGLPLNVRT